MFFNEQYDSIDYIKSINNNYNAIMEAARISEIRYYNDTGKSLFINEAGAITSFLKRIIEFFKSILNKIKEIFKKFFNHPSTSEKSHKEIEDKIKKLPENNKEKSITYPMYDISHICWNPFDSMVSIVEKSMDKKISLVFQDVDESIANNRHELLKNFKKIDEQGDIREELKKVYFSKDNEIEIKITSKNDALNYTKQLNELHKHKENIVKDYTVLKGNIEKYIKYLENLLKDENSLEAQTDSDTKMITNRIKEMKTLCTDATSIFMFLCDVYVKSTASLMVALKYYESGNKKSASEDNNES